MDFEIFYLSLYMVIPVIALALIPPTIVFLMRKRKGGNTEKIIKLMRYESLFLSLFSLWAFNFVSSIGYPSLSGNWIEKIKRIFNYDFTFGIYDSLVANWYLIAPGIPYLLLSIIFLLFSFHKEKTEQEA